jgi:hypothetical protein
MPVPDQALASVRQLQIAHAGEKGFSLNLDGLGQQLAGAGAQDIGQGIVNRVGLTQANDVGSVAHGVSLFLKRFWPAGHPPRYVALLTPSSPSFRHSSRSARGFQIR